ncbi:hypothetical protein OEZ85_009683 [Tetradesmus obliquus]|uniref:Methyltransferase type 11 domain-containing protein n=1 Tax=Tetradesmus obliquus TaxID=3088 RepID=A0ABY8UDN6_TETOB|nr:hypothetical protein OEZ85_009683 [Tetradesmus obliquus]
MASTAVASCSYGEAQHYESKQDKELETILEWYAEYDVLRPLLHKHLQYSDSILVLGPGTSALHEQLYESGYRGITCVDFCSKVLQGWRKRSADAGHTSLKYQHADIVTGLAFEHYPYNAIIDKGTLDCVLCRETGEQDAQQALTVIDNNLKNPGTFVMVSHSPPDVRLPLLKRVAWDSIQVKVIAPANLGKVAAGEALTMVREYAAAVQVPDHSVYVYICKKPY